MNDRDASGADSVISREMHICTCERKALRHYLLRRHRRRRTGLHHGGSTVEEDRHTLAEGVSLF